MENKIEQKTDNKIIKELIEKKYKCNCCNKIYTIYE